MLEIFKKVFNIACLLGFHDNVHIVQLTRADCDMIVRNQLADKGANVMVVNSLPLPSNHSKIVTSSICACCGKQTNNILKYSLARHKLYNTIYSKHMDAVLKYLDLNKELVQEMARVQKKQDKEANKNVWDLDK